MLKSTRLLGLVAVGSLAVAGTNPLLAFFTPIPTINAEFMNVLVLNVDLDGNLDISRRLAQLNGACFFGARAPLRRLRVAANRLSSFVQFLTAPSICRMQFTFYLLPAPIPALPLPW